MELFLRKVKTEPPFGLTLSLTRLCPNRWFFTIPGQAVSFAVPDRVAHSRGICPFFRKPNASRAVL
jgi:hypothetical protein